MLAPIFDCGKAIVRKGIQWLNQKLQQWSRPTDGRAVLETVTDLLRPKSELVLENALLRQQVIVLQCRAKRPNMTNLDQRLMVRLSQ
jgi:putative transposase